MKKITLSAAKLQLNKEKILDLTPGEMQTIRGGDATMACPTTTTCPEKTYDVHCAQPTTTVQPTYVCTVPTTGQ